MKISLGGVGKLSEEVQNILCVCAPPPPPENLSDLWGWPQRIGGGTNGKRGRGH